MLCASARCSLPGRDAPTIEVPHGDPGGDPLEDAGPAGGSGRNGSGGAGGGGGGFGSSGTGGAGTPDEFKDFNRTCGHAPLVGALSLFDGPARVLAPIAAGGAGGPRIEASGTVPNQGEGVPDDLDWQDDGLTGEFLYLRIKSDDRIWTFIAHGFTESAPGPAICDRVTLLHHDSSGRVYSPKQIEITLRSDDQVVFHYAYSGGPTGLALPSGLDVKFGDEYCEGASRCGTWSGHALEVRVPSGEQLAIRPDDVAAAGEYTVHAGSAIDELRSGKLERVNGCDDWHVGRAEVFVARRR